MPDLPLLSMFLSLTAVLHDPIELRGQPLGPDLPTELLCQAGRPLWRPGVSHDLPRHGALVTGDVTW